MPISRDDLCDGDRVRSLLKEARESDKVGPVPPVISMDFYLRSEYEAESNWRMADVATALSHFTNVDPNNSIKSAAMTARILSAEK